MAFGAHDYATVERILAARALPRTLDEYVAEDAAQRLERTLGHARMVPRDLTEYDRLPLTRTSRSLAPETPACPGEATPPEPSREIEDTTTTTPSALDSDVTSNSSD